MFEISPVLAGTFDSPNYVPARTNINQNTAADDTTAVADSSTVDPRRYSQFDRTASQVGDASMSFSDFLDMVNPLQHIPLVSSIYRAATGDTINPVSRIAGDVLYGGVFGAGSAIIGGVGAIADSVMEAKTGKDVTGTVVASLFGDDKTPPDNQLADQPTDQPIVLASAAAAAPATVAAPNNTASASTTPPVTQPVVTAALTNVAVQSAPPSDMQNPLLNKLKPLVRNNLPYGGAMAPLPNYHDQNLKMAIANASGGQRFGNMVFKNGVRSLPPAPTAPQIATTAAVPTTTQALPANSEGPVVSALPSSGDAASTAATTSLPYTPAPAVANAATTNAAVSENALPPALKDDALIMRALGLYRSVAETGTPASN